MAAAVLRRFALAVAIVAAGCPPVVSQGPAIGGPSSSPAVADSPAEALPAVPSAVATDAVRTYNLSLEEAKSRAVQTSIVMDLASSQVAAKCYALQAAQKDFLPKLLNSFLYYHFDRDLGTVVTTPGVFNPATAVSVPIVNQDAPLYTAMAIQPITPLLKVKAAVEIGEADLRAAQAQRQLARRELTKGAEQLYLGLAAARRIKGGIELAIAATMQTAESTGDPSAKIALVELQQNLTAVNSQCTQLQTQLNQLTGLSPCTELVIENPPRPQSPFSCVDELVNAAVSTSPKIREARMQVEKAAGAVRLAKADFVPSVNAYGVYVNQDATPVIQDSFSGVGVSASYLLEWGKKTDTLRQWKATEVLARQNLQKEIQDTQLAAIKAFHEVGQTEQALTLANQLAQLNRDAKLPTDSFQLKFALKDRLEAELGAVKADLAYRNAVVEVRSLAGFSE